MATARKSTTKPKSGPGFTDAERSAMKERAKELKGTGRGAQKKSDDAQAALDKIAEMSQPDRGIAERIHAIVTTTAPDLDPKTWYGMPAYAKDGTIVCFVQPSAKFGARYSMLGFNDAAKLDDGLMWPVYYAISGLTDTEAEKIEALVKQAMG